MQRIARGNSASARTLLLIFALCFLPGTAITCPAQTYNVLFNFSLAAGSIPEGQIVSDKAGNIYGVTVEGGANNFGAVRILASPLLGVTGGETLLYSFDNTSANGSYPEGGPLIMLKNLRMAITTHGAVALHAASGTGLRVEASHGSRGRVALPDHTIFEGGVTDGSDLSSRLQDSSNVYIDLLGGLQQQFCNLKVWLARSGSVLWEVMDTETTANCRTHIASCILSSAHARCAGGNVLTVARRAGWLRRLRQRVRAESAFRRRHRMDREAFSASQCAGCQRHDYPAGGRRSWTRARCSVLVPRPGRLIFAAVR